ncbi:MAG: cell division protein ZapA [Firmicutes bacterium]|nr:cell division protein ZapA [Bacillota bacterium]
MANDNIYRFRLFGVDYTLCGDKAPAEMEMIVRMVEQKMESIQELAPGYSTMRTVTLAALQLAEELYDARKDYTDMLFEANIGAEYDLFNMK